MIYIVLALSAHIFTLVASNQSEYLMTSGLYDALVYFQQLLVAICLYKFIPKQHVKLNVVCLLYTFSVLYSFIGYLFVLFLEGTKYEMPMHYIVDGIMCLFLISLVITNLMKDTKRCDEYKKRGTFIVYKKATSLQGFVSSFVTYPYGSSFLVVNGKEFKFKHGVVVERPHVNKPIYVYKRIEDMAIGEARDSLVGQEWGLFNNCFKVFGDIDRARNASNRG